MFQTTYTMSLGISIFFWIAIFPGMIQMIYSNSGMFANHAYPWIELLFYAFEHVHPLATHVIDSHHNMIKFDMRHFFASFIFYLSYSVFNWYITIRHGSAMYWTNDWINRPMLAFTITALNGFLVMSCFICLFFVTKAKLRRYNSRAAEINHSNEKIKVEENQINTSLDASFDAETTADQSLLFN